MVQAYWERYETLDYMRAVLARTALPLHGVYLLVYGGYEVGDH